MVKPVDMIYQYPGCDLIKKRETPERVNTTGNHKASKAQSQKSQSQEYGIFTQPCHALRFLCSSC